MMRSRSDGTHNKGNRRRGEGGGVDPIAGTGRLAVGPDEGSHRQFKNPTKRGTVTVAGKPSLDIPPGTLNSILKQADLKKRETDE